MHYVCESRPICFLYTGSLTAVLLLTHSCCSVAKLRPTLCDLIDCSTPGLPVPHHLLEFAQVHIHSIRCPPAISSSDVLFSFWPQSFSASGTFPVSRLFASDDQNTGASASVLPVNIQGWSSLILTGLILLSIGLWGVITRIWRHQFSGVLPSLWSSSLNHTWSLRRQWPWLYRPLSAE